MQADLLLLTSKQMSARTAVRCTTTETVAGTSGISDWLITGGTHIYSTGHTCQEFSFIVVYELVSSYLLCEK